MWSGVVPYTTVSTPAVKTRLHKSAEHTYLWALNTSPQTQNVVIRLSSEQGNFVFARALWGSFEGEVLDNTLNVAIPAQDGLVLLLK